ncbi:hypothetical protein A0H81_11828 [Grifola frondosa]|uniref:Uncharacterized protein n=1 Tax=Grifola frondosa TaxID=5627 RepID=A0A1C7LTY8_GRIFR|nr:hypothetical protein A0H81_11828 [Grifola frondosa]
MTVLESVDIDTSIGVRKFEMSNPISSSHPSPPPAGYSSLFTPYLHYRSCRRWFSGQAGSPGVRNHVATQYADHNVQLSSQNPSAAAFWGVLS